MTRKKPSKTTRASTFETFKLNSLSDDLSDGHKGIFFTIKSGDHETLFFMRNEHIDGWDDFNSLAGVVLKRALIRNKQIHHEQKETREESI